jgi:Ca2+-binding EF-hand superfamily protein
VEPPPDDFVAKMMAAAMEEGGLGEAKDMDSPGVSKSSPIERRFGGAEVKRYRRRSTDSVVGTTEKQKYLHMVLTTWIDISAGAPSIHIDEVAQVVKDNYQPSNHEIERVLQWLDTSQDGLVSFEEYCLGMAGVMKAAGLTAMDGQSAANEALASQLSEVLHPDPTLNKQEPVPGSPVSSPCLLEDLTVLLGEEVVNWLRENFDQADSTKCGNLAREQLIDLVKLTYVPRGAHLDKMLNWFEKKDLESMHVTKEAFMNGFYQLAEDLSFVLSPEQQAYTPSPRSVPRSPDRVASNITID